MVKPELRARTRLRERLREGRGNRSQAVFAGELGGKGWTQSKVAKIETGRQLPTPEELAEWAAASMPAAGLTAAHLVDLLTQAQAEYQAVRHIYAEHGGLEGFQQSLAVREAGALALFLYQPLMIPALLQTPEYARQVMQVPDEFPEQVQEDQLSRGIAARIRRQAILHEPDRNISIVVAEAALWTLSTSPSVHLAQLEYFAHSAESLTGVTVGVVPFTRQMPFVSMSGFTLYDDTVHVETLGGDLDVADPVDVQEFQVYARLLMTAAVTAGEAARLARDVRNRIVSGQLPG